MLDAFLEKMDQVFEKDSLLFHFNVSMQCVCVCVLCVFSYVGGSRMHRWRSETDNGCFLGLMSVVYPIFIKGCT